MIQSRLVDEIQSIGDITTLIELWLEHLKTCPWANTDCLFDNLKEEHALSWPLYFIQFETNIKGRFNVITHSTWKYDENRPSIDHLKAICKNLKIDFDKLVAEIQELPNTFHEQFWRKFEEEDEEIPDIFQKLMNHNLFKIYEKEIEHNERNLNDTDCLIMICLRMDNVFSNETITIHFENFINNIETQIHQSGHSGIEQLGIVYKRDENGGLRPFRGGLRHRIKALERITRAIMNRRFYNIRKADIVLDGSIMEAKGRQWINGEKYPTNSKRILEKVEY